ncbi:hypothetical protein C2S51_020588 [Perilla frutescens var. frutescens]|nr:hypothetical protein C2S51_020588 [Perilla frutescens var. frutescens]
MILCLDQNRAVDPWMWALVEDAERWNSFLWGAYSYQVLMYFINILPCRRQTIGRKGQGQYHFYGPIWALQIWACEVIPDLAREIGVHTGQLTLPRALRWTPRDPTTDSRTLLQGSLRVVSFVPSPEEMTTPYFMSMQLQAGAQSVRFVPSRSTNKKKLIANAASCCSSSAVDVVGPSARGIRAVQTPQKVRQGISRPSSRALRDEPDLDYILGLRPPAEEAAEHHNRSDSSREPPRAWGRKRSRRDRSQSSEEPSESFLQRVVAVIMPCVQDLQIAYSRFRLQGPDAVIQLYFNSDRLRQSWFDELEDPSTELKDIPAEGLIHQIQGSDGRYQVPWKGRDYAIVVYDVTNEHWVVVCIRFSDWVVELYDSLLYQMDDPSDRVHYERRDRELMPILRLLPRLLICTGFWEGRQMPPRCAFAMTLDKSILDQYMQTDGTSYGVYACMYVERLLDAGPPSGIPEEAIHAYRKVIGARIYSLTYIKRPSL